MSDENVSGILVNIFGGIMRCDIIAEGVVSAAQEIDLQVPLVVRLEGTNVEKGKSILAESGLPILSADNLSTAAQKIVDVVGIRADVRSGRPEYQGYLSGFYRQTGNIPF